MSQTIRNRSFGEILAASLALARREFFALLPWLAIGWGSSVFVALELIELVGPAELGGGFLAYLAFVAVATAAWTWQQFRAVPRVARALARRQAPSSARSLRAPLLRRVAYSLLFALLAAVAAIFVLPLPWLLVRFVASAPAFAVEAAEPADALGRSARLVHGRRFEVTYALGFVAVIALVPLALVVTTCVAAGLPSWAVACAGAGVAGLSSGPFAVLPCLLYFRLRAEQEAYDATAVGKWVLRTHEPAA